MPKMKTKSSMKRRVRLTATGKVRVTQAYKRHMNRRLSNEQRRRLKGTRLIAPGIAHVIKKYFLPYGEN